MSDEVIPANKNAGGRPEWQPTEEQRRTIEAMAGYGVPQEDIALVVEVDPKTLRKHCDRELRLGKIKANARVGQSLFEQGVGRAAEFDEAGNKTRAELAPNIAAAIWWSKAQMGWKETTVVETPHLKGREMSRYSDAELLAILEETGGSGTADEAGSEDEPAGLREGDRRSGAARVRPGGGIH